MSGILFFTFASCEPLSNVGIVICNGWQRQKVTKFRKVMKGNGYSLLRENC